MSPSSKLNDFSRKAIKREVIKQSLSHWLTLYPPALGLPLGLAALLFNMPVLYLGAIGSLSLSFASAIVNVFFREDIFANRYLERLAEKLEAEKKQTLENLANELEACKEMETAGELAAQGAAQFKKLQQKYDNVSSLLTRKLNKGELAYGRFIGAAEQVYLSGLDNLKQVAAILQSLGSIDPHYIRERLRLLENLQEPTDHDHKERKTLLRRLHLRDEQLEKINRLLTHNEEAMTSLEETTAAIATMRTDGGHGETDYEAAIEQLQEIAERAHIYNTR